MGRGPREWMRKPKRLEPAVTFEADQTGVAQILTSLQELSSGISPVRNHDHLAVSKERLEISQLFNGHFHRLLLCRDAPCVQYRGPTAWSLGQKNDLGVLPADA